MLQEIQTVGVQKGSTAADAVDSTKELKDADIQLLGDNVQILNDLRKWFRCSGYG